MFDRQRPSDEPAPSACLDAAPEAEATNNERGKSLDLLITARCASVLPRSRLSTFECMIVLRGSTESWAVDARRPASLVHIRVSAIFAGNPCLSAFLLPRGAPDPGAPPCMRQRLSAAHRRRHAGLARAAGLGATTGAAPTVGPTSARMITFHFPVLRCGSRQASCCPDSQPFCTTSYRKHLCVHDAAVAATHRALVEQNCEVNRSQWSRTWPSLNRKSHFRTRHTRPAPSGRMLTGSCARPGAVGEFARTPPTSASSDLARLDRYAADDCVTSCCTGSATRAVMIEGPSRVAIELVEISRRVAPMIAAADDPEPRQIRIV